MRKLGTQDSGEVPQKSSTATGQKWLWAISGPDNTWAWWRNIFFRFRSNSVWQTWAWWRPHRPLPEPQLGLRAGPQAPLSSQQIGQVKMPTSLHIHQDEIPPSEDKSSPLLCDLFHRIFPQYIPILWSIFNSICDKSKGSPIKISGTSIWAMPLILMGLPLGCV